MLEDTQSVADDSAFRHSLKELVRRHPAPLFLVRLSDTLILEASDAALEIAGRPRAEMVGMHSGDLIEKPETARRSLDLLASGVLDSYSRHVTLLRPDGTRQELQVRYTTCFNPHDRFAAIGEVVQRESRDLVGAPVGVAPDVTALGTVDGEWRIDRITSEVQELLGLTPRDLLGLSAFPAVHPEDIATVLLLAAHAASGQSGAAGRVRLKDAEDGWLWCSISLHELVGGAPGSFAFSISGDSETGSASTPRTKELEEHLRRIAREISASGVAALSTAMPTSLEVPEISDLTAREYEIVVRLARGERVPSIARTLFLSESTVRNHLTSVYRKFGVSSQHELLTRLSTTSGS